MNGWTQGDVADNLNVSQQIVSDWLEYMNEKWKGTIIYAGGDTEKNGGHPPDNISEDDLKEISTDIIANIRRCMRNPNEGM